MLKETFYITPQGVAKVKAELEHLRNVKRPEIIERLQDAKGGSDWMDNTEYIAIQDELAFVDGRIYELEDMLRYAEIIEDGEDNSIVNVGNTVVIEDDEGQLETYTIVGTVEADPSRGLISNHSPTGGALLGHEVGDEVTVETPGGVIHYRIVAVT